MSHQPKLSIKTKFYWLVIITTCFLLMPLIAMQFTNQVNWQTIDFIVMAALCLTIGSAFIILSDKYHAYRTAIAISLLLIFIYLWAELAVGVFAR